MEIKKLRHAAFSDNTHAAYAVHIKAFLSFCYYFKLKPLPADDQTILRYVVFLSRTLKPQSTRCYLNGIRILHLENSYSNPLDNNYYLKTLLKGIDCTFGTPPLQKLPITLEILSRMLGVLDMKNSLECCFFTACLVAFYTFFRKSTLLTKTKTSHDCKRDLCRSDVKFGSDGAIINVKYTKTLRDFSRVFAVPIPLIPRSHLCPVSSLRRLLQSTPGPHTAPLFSYVSETGLTPLTHSIFNTMLKKSLSHIGLDVSKYSGHSLRRAGASFALACGLPPQVIKSQGGWASDCYMRYTDVPLELRLQCSKVLGIKTRLLSNA